LRALNKSAVTRYDVLPGIACYGDESIGGENDGIVSSMRIGEAETISEALEAFFVVGKSHGCGSSDLVFYEAGVDVCG